MAPRNQKCLDYGLLARLEAVRAVRGKANDTLIKEKMRLEFPPSIIILRYLNIKLCVARC